LEGEVWEVVGWDLLAQLEAFLSIPPAPFTDISTADMAMGLVTTARH
jgi:hypothetical protein